MNGTTCQTEPMMTQPQALSFPGSQIVKPGDGPHPYHTHQMSQHIKCHNTSHFTMHHSTFHNSSQHVSKCVVACVTMYHNTCHNAPQHVSQHVSHQMSHNVTSHVTAHVTDPQCTCHSTHHRPTVHMSQPTRPDSVTHPAELSRLLSFEVDHIPIIHIRADVVLGDDQQAS